jgi:uncharacterized glyoxalase superfamily protein PhnB
MPNRRDDLMRTNRSMPTATVIPVMSYLDVSAATKWLEDAFGFQTRLRIGDHRAQLSFGDGAVVIQKDETPRARGAGHVAVMVRVAHVDAHLARARLHGARIIQELEEFPYGERQYSCLDLAGFCWTFSESVADIDPQDWGGELLSP